MKRVLQAVIFLLLVIGIPGFGMASPFLVSDYYPASDPAGLPDEFSITYGTVTVVGASTIEADAQGNRRLRWDLGTLAPGTYNLQVKALKNDPIWGAQESPAVPFTFTKPALAPLRSPVSIRLLK